MKHFIRLLLFTHLCCDLFLPFYLGLKLWSCYTALLSSHRSDGTKAPVSMAPARHARSLERLRFLMPRIDLCHLLVRFRDRLLGLPALDEDPLDHMAEDVGREHLACGGIHGPGRGELPAMLQHHAPVLEHRTLPEVRVIHALVRWAPAPIAFLDHHLQILWRHPVLHE